MNSQFFNNECHQDKENKVERNVDDKGNVPRAGAARRLFSSLSNSDTSSPKPLNLATGKRAGDPVLNSQPIKQEVEKEVREKYTLSQKFEALYDAFKHAKVELALEQQKVVDLQSEKQQIVNELQEMKEKYKNLETRHMNLKEKVSSLNKKNTTLMMCFTAELSLMKSQVVENLLAVDKSMDEDSE